MVVVAAGVRMVVVVAVAGIGPFERGGGRRGGLAVEEVKVEMGEWDRRMEAAAAAVVVGFGRGGLDMPLLLCVVLQQLIN